MTSHILVAPLNENLLRRLQGQRLIIRINALEDLSEVARCGRRFQFHLHCCWYRTESPLSSLIWGDNCQNVPMAIYSSKLGSFPELMGKLPALRKLNLRVYLPTDFEENYTSLRILSSLGIASAVVFKGKSLNWELLSDLMTYALLGLAPHASIEPFHYIASHYDSSRRTDYSAVYFADPVKYLHVDEEGRVALSLDDLTSENFLIQDLDQLDALESCEGYTKRLGGWRDSFLLSEGCAYCQGWRVCLGKFRPSAEFDPGCRGFFVELMEVVEQHLSFQNHKKLWRP